MKILVKKVSTPKKKIRNVICYLSSCLFLVLLSCETNEEPVSEDYSNCRYERPEAIFYDGLSQISDHQFQARGRGSEETFVLSGGIGVTIFQYGCDYRTQEFVFDLGKREACDDPNTCTHIVAQLFQSLARLGPEYQVFRAWGLAIKDTASEIRFGKSIPLAEGFWIKIDEKKSLGSTTLMLTLSEKE